MSLYGPVTAEFVSLFVVPLGSPPTTGYKWTVKRPNHETPGRYALTGFAVSNLVVSIPNSTAKEVTGWLQFPWDLDGGADLKDVRFHTLSGVKCSISGPKARKNLLQQVQSFGPELRKFAADAAAAAAAALTQPPPLSREDRFAARERELTAVQAAFDAQREAQRTGTAAASSPPLPVPIFSFGFPVGRGVPYNSLLPIGQMRVDVVLQLLRECGGGTLIKITKSIDDGRDVYTIPLLGMKVGIPRALALEAGDNLVRFVLDWDVTKPGRPSAIHLMLDDRTLKTWEGPEKCPFQAQFIKLAEERERFVRYIELFEEEQHETIEDRHRALFEGGAKIFLVPDGQVYKLNEVHRTSISKSKAKGAGQGARLHVVLIEDKQEWWLVITDKHHKVHFSEPVRVHFRLRMLIGRMVNAMVETDWPRSLTVPETGTEFRGGVKGSAVVEA